MSVAVRRAGAGDAAGIARVHVLTWQSTYRGMVPQSFLDSLDIASRTEDWKIWLEQTGVHTFVAERDSEICGFAGGGPAREAEKGFDVELYAIYVLPEAWKNSIGRHLLTELTTALHEKGGRSMMAWVSSGNPALRFYERFGAERLTQKIIRIGDAELEETAVGWRDLEALRKKLNGEAADL